MSVDWILVGCLVLAAILTNVWFRSLAFTAWVLAGVGSALLCPEAFLVWGGLSLATLIVPLIQLIMFGMGTTLNCSDFARIAREPWPVVLGIGLQYGVMPITGYLLVIAFGFSGEIAAGIILTGACSGGVASNLMSYIGKGNVALSVTMTALSTLVAPVMTPLAMKLFAGQYIDVDAGKMLIGVINIIIAPVFAGVIANAILYQEKPWGRRSGLLLGIGAGLLLLAAFAVFSPAVAWGPLAGLRNSIGLGLVLIGGLSIVKGVLVSQGNYGNLWLDRALPLLSMFGVCAILTIITAQTRDVLMQVGGVLFLAAVIHNSVGLLLGYWGARALGGSVGRIGHRLGFFTSPDSRLSERDCRTVAFEVGMQNGGMATGLAMEVLKSHVAALPPNVFGAWMNISGSLLANYWSRKANSSASEAAVDGDSEVAVEVS